MPSCKGSTRPKLINLKPTSNHVAHELGQEIAECVIGAMVSHKPNALIIEECLRCVSILGTHAEIRLMISKFKGDVAELRMRTYAQANSSVPAVCQIYFCLSPLTCLHIGIIAQA
jgi:hypothetical protein